MKCKYCNGTGEVEIVGDSVTDVCDKCGGTGFFCEMRMGDVCTLGSPCPHQEPLTNEEWFCQLSTEEKAKRIINIAVNSDCDYRTIVEWLKEEHKE